MRAAPHPGPRCTTHHRRFTRAAKVRGHRREVSRRFDMPDWFYDALLAMQDGRCAVHGCRARGLSRRLAVDHDHACTASHGDVIRLCCVRGLLCVTHNRWLGLAGDDRQVFASLAAYLDTPPARRLSKHFLDKPPTAP